MRGSTGFGLPLAGFEGRIGMKKIFSVLCLTALLCLLCLSAPGFAEETAKVADASHMTTVQDVAADGMEPVYAEALNDGVYEAAVDSSSSMFRIERCALRVEDGELTAELTMSSESYAYLYPGTAAEAAAAARGSYLTPGEDGRTFTLPIPALDAGVSCAAWSRNKELWYDRTLLFRSDSLPLAAFRDVKTVESLALADGEYIVEAALEGGSGRAKIQSPCRLWIRDGAAAAEIVWGSANYDYMKADGAQIPAEIRDGHSVCVIPVPAFDRSLHVIADTTAMSRPHEIEYTLRFEAASITPAA